jgi:hypothetical protein
MDLISTGHVSCYCYIANQALHVQARSQNSYWKVTVNCVVCDLLHVSWRLPPDVFCKVIYC